MLNIIQQSQFCSFPFILCYCYRKCFYMLVILNLSHTSRSVFWIFRFLIILSIQRANNYYRNTVLNILIIRSFSVMSLWIFGINENWNFESLRFKWNFVKAVWFVFSFLFLWDLTTRIKTILEITRYSPMRLIILQTRDGRINCRVWQSYLYKISFV